MKKVAADVFQLALMPRNALNAYVIDDILVDAGIKSSFKKIMAQLKNFEINAHLLTHSHPDHQGSSAALCEALDIPLWCGEKEKEAVESGFTVSSQDFKSKLWGNALTNYGKVKGHQVDRLLKEGDQVGSFSVIETPGHTRGHISLFREKDGVLIVGDVYLNMNILTTIPGLHHPPGLFTVDKALNISSMKKLLALEPKILCFGHGPVMLNDGQLEQFLRHMKSN